MYINLNPSSRLITWTLLQVEPQDLKLYLEQEILNFLLLVTQDFGGGKKGVERLKSCITQVDPN